MIEITFATGHTKKKKSDSNHFFRLRAKNKKVIEITFATWAHKEEKKVIQITFWRKERFFGLAPRTKK